MLKGIQVLNGGDAAHDRFVNRIRGSRRFQEAPALRPIQQHQIAAVLEERRGSTWGLCIRDIEAQVFAGLQRATPWWCSTFRGWSAKTSWAGSFPRVSEHLGTALKAARIVKRPRRTRRDP